MTYSFDVFDTCLIRKCGIPKNALDILSFHVFTEEVDETVRQLFVASRIAAQESLWPREDISLNDIYEAFNYCHPYLVGKERLIQRELECEEKLLIPIRSTLSKVKELHKKGHHILFVSDMYLPFSFILSLLKNYGFYEDGDKLYLSYKEKASKSSGELFRLVKEKEHLQFKKWEHWGDNKQSDYLVPRRLGIRAHLFTAKSTPYVKKWEQSNYETGTNFKGIIAGLSRAFHNSYPDSIYKDFILDIIAPFYCSFTHRILKDAQKEGIQTLFFCARDTWQIYLIAKKMNPMFPDIQLKYFHISKKALYDSDEQTKLLFFEQIGLANNTNKNAIVDIRSSGHTLDFLNKLLSNHHYNKVRGYYFELFSNGKISYPLDNYYCEINSAYHHNSIKHSNLMGCWHLYESLFSLNNQKRTIDYTNVNGKSVPVFGEESDNTEECFLENKESVIVYYTNLLSSYTDSYLQMNLYNYSDRIFREIAIPTLMSFFRFPVKYYLKPLEHFYAYHWIKQKYVPYVKKEPLFALVKSKGRDTMWRKGTVINSIPLWIIRMLIAHRR